MEATITETLLQIGSEIAIDLDRIQLAGRLEQIFGQCATPRADLHEWIAWLRIDRFDDVSNDAAIMQKILTKTLASENHQRRSTSCRASCNAAVRLPLSARPVPAKDSAVP